MVAAKAMPVTFDSCDSWSTPWMFMDTLLVVRVCYSIGYGKETHSWICSFTSCDVLKPSSCSAEWWAWQILQFQSMQTELSCEIVLPETTFRLECGDGTCEGWEDWRINSFGGAAAVGRLKRTSCGSDSRCWRNVEFSADIPGLEVVVPLVGTCSTF